MTGPEIVLSVVTAALGLQLVLLQRQYSARLAEHAAVISLLIDRVAEMSPGCRPLADRKPQDIFTHCE